MRWRPRTSRRTRTSSGSSRNSAAACKFASAVNSMRAATTAPPISPSHTAGTRRPSRCRRPSATRCSASRRSTIHRSTAPPAPSRLQLGLDIVELYREVRPTWKMGIKFDWGQPGDYYFNYPFGNGNPVEAQAHDGHINNQSLCSLMMSADRAPIVIGDDGAPISLLEYMPYAYHLENKSFVAHLEKCARAAGIG